MTDSLRDPSTLSRLVRVDTSCGRITAAVDGTTAAYVLLLLSIPGYRRSWAAIAPALAETCRDIVPDLLGFGESIPRNGPHHIRGQADGIATLLKELGADTYHLVGFD